jgi:hypothetical protein
MNNRTNAVVHAVRCAGAVVVTNSAGGMHTRTEAQWAELRKVLPAAGYERVVTPLESCGRQS